MKIRLMAHGIYRSHFIYSGSSGTAAVTADITVFSLEKKKDRNLAINLKSIMASGQSSASMGSRYIEIFLTHQTPYYSNVAIFFLLCDQEPISVALSALNLAVQFHGWVSFFILVNYKLPFTPNKKTYYAYAGLWHVYAIFAMNSWFWTAVFLSR